MICSSGTRRTPASLGMRLPADMPPLATRVCTIATERALPWPLAAGISAPCQPDRPALCAISWAIVTSAFPAAAKQACSA